MAKTDKNMQDDPFLETLFETARADDIQPSETLMSAIVADAAKHQPRDEPLAAPSAPARPKAGFWRDLAAAIGGWPSMAGLVSATVAGVWIGFAAPTQVETLSGGLILSDSIAYAEGTYSLEDLTPSYLGTSLLLEDEG